MARQAVLVATLLVLCLLCLPPGLAWYKQAAGPSYYSVGRAAGLLSGFRRAPYARRSEPPVAVFPRLHPGLRSLVSVGKGVREPWAGRGWLKAQGHGRKGVTNLLPADHVCAGRDPEYAELPAAS